MATPLTRRHFLTGLAAGLAAPWGVAGSVQSSFRVAALWQSASSVDRYWFGCLSESAADSLMQVDFAHELPTRAHGLLQEADGSLLVVAVRPGLWLRRYAADGELRQEIWLDRASSRRLNGHIVASRDGRWLYTGETDVRDDSGWIVVREAKTLREVAVWSSHGIEPHQLMIDADGALVVANGGIRRTADDHKRDLDRMDSSLVRLDSTTGSVLGHWKLDDPRLSLRHLAWSISADEIPKPILGIAVQAEHEEPGRRHQAPVLAVWDGYSMQVPTRSADAVGYAGDIVAAPGGGFVISSYRVDQVLWWHPTRPSRLQSVARLTEAYAVGSTGLGDLSGRVAIASKRGAAFWHPTEPPSMRSWPEAMALDNHWLLLK